MVLAYPGRTSCDVEDSGGGGGGGEGGGGGGDLFVHVEEMEEEKPA